MKTRTLQAGNSGFTLFELLIVLLIVGLVFSVAIFSAERLHDRTIFNEEARRLYQIAKHAKELAVMERRDIFLKIDTDTKSYWLSYDNEKKTDVHRIPDRFNIKGSDIIFYAKGNSSGGILSLSNEKGKEYVIEVDPVLGAPTIKRL